MRITGAAYLTFIPWMIVKYAREGKHHNQRPSTLNLHPVRAPSDSKGEICFDVHTVSKVNNIFFTELTSNYR